MVTNTGLWLVEAIIPWGRCICRNLTVIFPLSPQLVRLCVTGTENMTIDGGPVRNNLSSLQTQHKWWSIQHTIHLWRISRKKLNFYNMRWIKDNVNPVQNQDLYWSLTILILRKKVWHRPWDDGGCGLDWAGPGSQDHERHYAMISDVSPSLSLSSSLSLSPRYWEYGAKKSQYITAAQHYLSALK